MDRCDLSGCKQALAKSHFELSSERYCISNEKLNRALCVVRNEAVALCGDVVIDLLKQWCCVGML